MKDRLRALLRHEVAILVIVLIAFIGGMSVITHGRTTTTANITNVLLQSTMRGLASIGQTFVILSGGIDVSLGGIGLMTSILGATLITQSPELSIVAHPVPVYVGIAAIVLAGAGWGVINGLSVSRVGMPALIVTLAMWQITRGFGFALCRGYSIYHLPEALAVFGQGRVAGVPVPVIIFIAVAVVAYFVLNYTAFGRSVYAVGGNPVSAWLSGINVKRVLLSVYVISGFLAGLAGVVITSRCMSASMRTLAGLEIDSIAAVTVGGVSLAGGKGTLTGAILGVLIIGFVNNAMSILGADPAMQDIVKGVIIFTAVFVDYIRRR